MGFEFSGVGGNQISRVITEDTTIYVATTGSDTTGDGSSSNPFYTINQALASIGERTISETTTVTVSVADGTYTMAETVVLGRPDGNRIEIIGNTTDATSVVLEFASGQAGFEARENCSIGLIDGMTIKGQYTSATSTERAIGVHSARASYIELGEHISVTYFYRCIELEFGSVIIAHDLDLSHCVWGIYCSFGANMHAQDTTITDCNDTTNSRGYGIEIGINGSVELWDLEVTNCLTYGVLISNGRMQAQTINIDGSDGRGVSLLDGATLYVVDTCYIINCTSYGLELKGNSQFHAGGTVDISGCSVGIRMKDSSLSLFGSNNELHSNTDQGIYCDSGCHAYLYDAYIHDNGSHGAYLSAGCFGSLRSAQIDDNGGYGIYAEIATNIHAGLATFSGNTSGDVNITKNSVSSDNCYVKV